MGNEIQDSVIKAMELLAGSMDKKSQGTTTYEGRIVEVIDEESYYVDFRGNRIQCFSADINKKYVVGENVIFIVPQNDMTDRKTIIGSSTPGTAAYEQDNEDKKYIDISGNILNGLKDEYRLTTYRDLYYPIINIDQANIDILNRYIQSNYRNYSFNMKIFTHIAGPHRCFGNYGGRLILKLKTKDGQATDKAVVLDTDNMLGDIYGLEDPDYTKQSTYFTIENGMTVESGSILLFSLDFPDEYIEKNEEGVLPEDRKPETGTVEDGPTQYPDLWDIYIKDIQINVLDSIANAADDTHNLLMIQSSRGLCLNSKEASDSTILTPVLYVQGQPLDLTNNENINSIYWFEENPLVDKNSNFYKQEGGLYWKCINEYEKSTDENTQLEKYSFSEKQESIEVRTYNKLQSDETYNSLLFLQKKIKCVFTYRNIPYEATIDLTDLEMANEYDILLYPTNGQSTYPNQIGDVDITCVLEDLNENTPTEFTTGDITCVWYLYNRNMKLKSTQFYTCEKASQYLENDYKYLYNQIKFPTHLIDDYCFIKAELYINNKDVSPLLIGSKTIAISTSDNLSYVLTIENADPLYKYDKDGDSPLTQDLYDGPASSKITETKPFIVRLYNENGLEIDVSNYTSMTVDWYVPAEKTMIEINMSDVKTVEINGDKYYVKTTTVALGKRHQLEYKISKKYRRDYNNNSILVIAKYDGCEVSNYINVQFTKDMFGGVDGAKYSLILGVDTGTANSDGDWYPYESRLNAEEGLCKLKVYRFRDNYYYCLSSYRTGELKIYPDGGIKFSCKYYINGEEITLPTSPQYKIFGQTEIIDTDSNSYCMLTRGQIADVPNETQTNILQASLQIADGTKTYKLYAYYPIEVINCSAFSYSENKAIAIPHSEYGFDTVFYTPEGVNPQYDYAQDFSYNLGDNYLSNLLNETAIKEAISRSCENEKNLDDLAITEGDVVVNKVIKPTSKYNRDTLVNYVQYNFTMTNLLRDSIKAIRDDVLKKELSDLQPEYTDKEKWDDICEYMTNNYFKFLNVDLVNAARETGDKTPADVATTFFNDLKNKLGDDDGTDNPSNTFNKIIIKLSEQIKTDDSYDSIINNVINPFKVQIFYDNYLVVKDGDNGIQVVDMAEGLKNKYTIDSNQYEEKREILRNQIDACNRVGAIPPNVTITSYQPIAFVYDYEMLADMTNYDGTNIQSGSRPNAGSGSWDGNAFTGVMFGSEKEAGNLLGYCGGEPTFSLDSKGNLKLQGCGHSHENGTLTVKGTSNLYGSTTVHNSIYLKPAGFRAENIDGTNTTSSGSNENEKTLNQIYSGYSLYDMSGDMASGNRVVAVNTTGFELTSVTAENNYVFGKGVFIRPNGQEESLSGYLALGNKTSITWQDLLKAPLGSTNSQDVSNSSEDIGALYSIKDYSGNDSHDYSDAVSGIGSNDGDTSGLWSGWNADTGLASFISKNKYTSLGNEVLLNQDKKLQDCFGSTYVYNLSIGGSKGPWESGNDPQIVLSDTGWAGFAGGKAYIDKDGNFVSPNLICGVANGSSSNPGLGLGSINTTGGQIVVNGGSITACGNIPFTGDFKAMASITNNQLTGPRLQISKGNNPLTPILVRGWIKVNGQYIYIGSNSIKLPSETTKATRAWNYVTLNNSGCSINAGPATASVSYSITPGSITISNGVTIITGGSINFSRSLTNGWGDVTCTCSGCGCGTKSASIQYYEWADPKPTFSYKDNEFQWDLSDFDSKVTALPVGGSCSCPSCPPEGGGGGGETATDYGGREPSAGSGNMD